MRPPKPCFEDLILSHQQENQVKNPIFWIYTLRAQIVLHQDSNFSDSDTLILGELRTIQAANGSYFPVKLKKLNSCSELSPYLRWHI